MRRGKQFVFLDYVIYLVVARIIRCDNSRSFVTGEFTKKPSRNVNKFNDQQMRSLKHWVKFYRKEYPKVGKIAGVFYDSYGRLSGYGLEVKRHMKAAEEAHWADDKKKQQYPPCNIEWEAEVGSRVWCTKRSGGIERDWVGVPRQLYEAGATDYRCACIHEGHKNEMGNLKEYDGCAPDSETCYMK